MVDHNLLKNEISVANRYRKLQELRTTISGLRRKLPLSISSELEARVTEKLRTYDYPICSAAAIRIIFSNGLSKEMESDECQKAMARGMKLSDYIFSRYISARDFQIDSPETVGSLKTGIYSNSMKPEERRNVELTPMSSDELRERIDFLMKKVEGLERIGAIYAENIPKIARDVNDLKEKMEIIYKKVLEK